MFITDDENLNNQIVDATSFLYSYFKYANISSQDLEQIIREVTSNSKEKVNDSDYGKYVIAEIYKELLSIIKSITVDEQKMYALIDSFTKDKFSEQKDYKSAINNIKKISLLFEEYDYNPSLDFLMGLINHNENIKTSIVYIYEEYIKQLNEINNKRINNDFDDSFVVSLIDAYCSLNDIDIDVDYKDESDDNSDNIDLVKEYLKSIGNIALLTPEEEKNLALK